MCGVSLPVGPACTFLLGLFGVDSMKAVVGEELRHVLVWESGALGNAGMVLVIELVRSSHYGWPMLEELIIISLVE